MGNNYRRYEELSDSTPTDLILVEKLVHKGKYNEALQVVETFEKRENLTVNGHLMNHLFKSTLLNKLRRFEEGFELAKRALQMSHGLGNYLRAVEAHTVMAEALCRLGKLDESLDMISQGEVTLETLISEQSSNMSSEIPSRVASFNYLKAAIYELKGELDQALEHHQQVLSMRRRIITEGEIAWFQDIGELYSETFSFNSLSEFLQQLSTLQEQTNNKQNVAASLNSIGTIYYNKGDIDQAFGYHQQSLTLQEQIKNPLLISETLFYLIIVAIGKNSLEQAQHYLRRLKQISNQEKNIIIGQRYRVAEALMLKASTRLRNKIKAAELLEQVVKEEIIEHRLSVTTILNLCDLLLFELGISGEEEILDEIQRWIQQLLEIAKEHHQYPLLVEGYVLKSNLALLKLDIHSAQQFLEQAQVITKEKGFLKLAVMVSSEYNTFQEQMDKWHQLIERNAPIGERLELLQLEKRIMDMLRKRLKITEEEIFNYAKQARNLVESWKEDTRYS